MGGVGSVGAGGGWGGGCEGGGGVSGGAFCALIFVGGEGGGRRGGREEGGGGKEGDFVDWFCGEGLLATGGVFFGEVRGLGDVIWGFSSGGFVGCFGWEFWGKWVEI